MNENYNFQLDHYCNISFDVFHFGHFSLWSSFILFILHLKKSSRQVKFSLVNFDPVDQKLNCPWCYSILVVFHFGCLPFLPSFICIFFNFGYLPFRLSSILIIFLFAIFHFGCLPYIALKSKSISQSVACWCSAIMPSTVFL